MANPLDYAFGRFNQKCLVREEIWDSENVLTRWELSELFEKAKLYAGPNSVPCHWFCRNEPQWYFDDIVLNKEGIMETYIKDKSGDPGSPINGRTNGLFFMAKKGQPSSKSPFGNTRLCIPVMQLLQMAPKLYFTDFYCMRSVNRHYVTLVMTSPGSETDRFCARYLLPLDMFRNPFLFYGSKGRLKVAANKKLSVECLFTEDIDISGCSLTYSMKTLGRGQSAGNRQKNPICTECNLALRHPATTGHY